MSLLTFMMNAMSHCEGIPSSVGINFSIPWSVAAAVHGRGLGPDELQRDRVPRLAGLAARVRLHHDWSLTAASSRAFAGVAVPGFAGTDARAILSALGRMRAAHPPMSLALAMIPALSSLWPDLRAASRKPVWDEEALARFVWTFPARVRLRTHDGRVQEARVDVPYGAGPTRAAASREKLAKYAPRYLGELGTRALASAIDADASGLVEFLAPGSESLREGARSEHGEAR